MKNAIILFTLTTVLLFSACKENGIAQEIKVLTPIQFQDAMKNNDIQIIDARTAAEFEEGHLENAQNIDVLESDFAVKAEKLDVAKPIYVYCKSGKRSAKATLILKDLGFTEIYDMKGGYLLWQSEVPN